MVLVGAQQPKPCGEDFGLDSGSSSSNKSGIMISVLALIEFTTMKWSCDGLRKIPTVFIPYFNIQISTLLLGLLLI